MTLGEIFREYRDWFYGEYNIELDDAEELEDDIYEELEDEELEDEELEDEKITADDIDAVRTLLDRDGYPAP